MAEITYLLHLLARSSVLRSDKEAITWSSAESGSTEGIFYFLLISDNFFFYCFLKTFNGSVNHASDNRRIFFE